MSASCEQEALPGGTGGTGALPGALPVGTGGCASFARWHRGFTWCFTWCFARRHRGVRQLYQVAWGGAPATRSQHHRHQLRVGGWARGLIIMKARVHGRSFPKPYFCGCSLRNAHVYIEAALLPTTSSWLHMGLFRESSLLCAILRARASTHRHGLYPNGAQCL